ncbi:MAG: adenylate/guanylate cyclase domain-containing protein [Flavobacteriales bacterium]
MTLPRLKGALLNTLLLALTLLLSGTVNGQRYFFENIGVQEGLPASKVYATLQDGYGLVWIGTEAGLASYDGNTVVNHGTQEGVAPNGGRSLLLDKEGHLWVGHLDGGITYYDGSRFRALHLGADMHSAVTGLAQAGDGTIWASTAGHGAFKFKDLPQEGDQIQVIRFAEDKGLQPVLLNIVSLADGRVCVVEDRGTLRAMEPGKDRFVDLELPGWQELFSCNNMYQDSHGAIWLATRGGGAFKLEAGKVLQYSPANGLGSGAVYCFGEDNDGQVWVGTIDGGLSVIGKEGVRTFSKANGLHSTFVRCIGRDREGNLLIGTNDNGLDIFKGDRFVSFGTDDGLTDPQVWAVAEDDNGRAWFGTNGGIVILSGRDGRGGMRTITAQQGALTDNFIRCLREDDKGYMWIGTDHGGLLRYDPRTDRVTGDIELSGTLAEGKVTALEVGQSGEIWVGGLNGLRRYLPGSGTPPTFITEEDGLAGNHVVAIFRDKKGSIWVGSTVHGITRIDNGQAKHIDLGRSFTATSFVQDDDGRLWVGTEGQGIVVLENGKEVQRFTEAEGLLSNTIKALGRDQFGHVWIGTNKGLNKWRPKKGGFVAFTERAGFTGIEVKPNAVWTTKNGDLWFGTANGATRVGSENEAERSVPPLVAIRGWKVNLEDRPMQEVRLSHSDRNVRIAYSSVSLSDPGAVRYMYKLKGLDEDWQPITTETDAYYPALPPASYTFQVKAMDRTGLWSDPPAELKFTILPPWYRSWWFYTALVLAISIALFSYIKVRERQLRMRNLILERKVEERTAEVVAQSKEIEGQKVRIEDLLLNILPKEVSEELKEKGKATARRYDQVTVMFTDMKGFTQMAEKMTPEELVNELDDCFIRFDEVIGRYGIEKIKTIGDSYMSACGVPKSDPHHAVKAVMAAMEVNAIMNEWHKEHLAVGKQPWTLRIGLHSGPVVAGVVGKRKFAYDIWGDAVNTASRMESSGAPGEVNISGTTYSLVKDYFECEHRGQVEAKNKGRIDMYFVRRLLPAYSADAKGMRPNAALLAELGVAVEQLA